MTPSTARLLDAAQQAIAALKSAGLDAANQQLCLSLQIALNEVQLREDGDFMPAHIEQGRALEREAAALGNAAPAALAGESERDRLMGSLAGAVERLGQREREEPVRALLRRIVDWENALYARRAQPPAPRNDAPDTRFSEDNLARYLATRFPDRAPFQIEGLRTLTGGFSKVTVLFDAIDGAGDGRALVIRAEQPHSIIFLEGSDVRNEFRILQSAARAGVPVAEPLWLEEDAAHFGMRFLVSAHASGRNFGSRIDVTDTISDGLLRDVVASLVRIHALDPADPALAASHISKWSRRRTLTEANAATIAYWKAQSADFGIGRLPILARAFAWLERNVPPEHAPPSVLHGDYGLHNILIGDDDRVSCILDWEACSYGDPADDLVWLTEGLKVAGIERGRVIDLYHELGGRPVSEARLAYFDVMNCVRFAVTCSRAAYLFDRDPAIGINACQLGLMYMYHGTHRLNENIARAEALLDGGR